MLLRCVLSRCFVRFFQPGPPDPHWPFADTLRPFATQRWRSTGDPANRNAECERSVSNSQTQHLSGGCEKGRRCMRLRPVNGHGRRALSPGSLTESCTRRGSKFNKNNFTFSGERQTNDTADCDLPACVIALCGYAKTRRPLSLYNLRLAGKIARFLNLKQTQGYKTKSHGRRRMQGDVVACAVGLSCCTKTWSLVVPDEFSTTKCRLHDDFKYLILPSF